MSAARAAAFACVVALVLSATTPARSEPARADAGDGRASASASFREAQAAFARRDYAAAAAAFEDTARVAPHPATWLNAAEAWELRGDIARAAEACDRALAVSSAASAMHSEAQKRLASLAERIVTLDVRGPRGFGARVDDDAVRPLPVVRRLAAGKHRVIVVDLKSGRESVHEVNGAPGDVRLIEVPEPERRPEVARADAVRASGPPLGAWIAFGAGAALGITAAAMGVVTLDAKSTYQRDPTRDTLDGFDRDRLVTNLALGGAVVAVAVGVGLWLFAPRSANDRASLPTVPAVVF